MTRRILAVLAAAICGMGSAAAQTAPPPHLSVLEGQAVVVRGADREAAIANTPLALGDRLEVDAGRAEVLLGDGSALHLDERTTIDINGDQVVRLFGGRVIVMAERGAAGMLQIDAAPASVRIQSSAEVHIALVGDGLLQVAVARGLVDVEAEAGRVAVGAGQQVFVREGEAPSYPAAFNSARADGFVRWSQALLDARRGSSSAQYLPADVRIYGSTFDQYGSWSYAAPYGYVWYPRVAPTWRPYHHGRWRHGVGFGWTFVGYDPWGWATHHYGRWGMSAAGAWFWIPRPGWRSAWVHWAVAPGYVGWCPLGWNDRPVLGFWGHGLRYARGYDPWRAWSVIPTRSFRSGAPIHRQAFDPRVVTGRRAPSFVLQPTPPNVAIPRGSVVPPAYRVAGPSVTPGGGSRRGRPVAGSATAATAVPRRPGSSLGSMPNTVGRVPGTVRGSTDPAASRTGSPMYRMRGTPRTTPPAPPPVIYHRGSPIDPRGQQHGGNPYDRAGVAVPRGLPADVDAGRPGDVGTAQPRARSPYGGYTSPYSRGRGGDDRSGVMRGPARSGDHPDYAVPRSAPRQAAPAPSYAPPPSQQAPPRTYSPPPRSRGGDGRPAAPRAAPAPRSSSGPPPSRGQGRSAARSGGDRPSSGTAVPRRR